MRTRNIAFPIAALVIVAAGCAVVDHQFLADPTAKYTINFGTHVKLADKKGFIAVLKRASWYREIAFSPHQSGDPTGDFTGVSTASSTIHSLTITQNSTANPNSLHVTQRVGLNNASDVKELLSKIQE